MDKEKMSGIYQRLVPLSRSDIFEDQPLSDFSVTDSDIIMSDEMGRILDDIEEGQSLKKRGDLVRMQLAASEMMNFIENKLNEDFLSLPREEQYQRCAAYLLDYNIGAYSKEEQKTILFNMLAQAQDLNGTPFNEHEELQYAKKSLADLRNDVIYSITGLMPQVKNDYEVDVVDTVQANQAAGNVNDSLQNQDFSVGAAACAAYAADENLRHFPETIGLMCAAMPRLEREKKQRIRLTDLVLGAIVSSLVFNFLFFGVINIPGALFIAGSGELKWLKDIYDYFLQAFSVNTELASHNQKTVHVTAQNSQQAQQTNDAKNQADNDDTQENQIDENQDQYIDAQ